MNYSESRAKFEQDLQTGKSGEQSVYDILQRFSNVTGVVDVSDNQKYQKLEIDAIVTFTNRVPITIEVKTDFFEKTGNIVFEVFSSKTRRTAGGFVKSQSDFILYYFPNTNTLYSIETNPFKQYVLDNRNSLRFGNMGDDAQGFIIPIKTLERQEWFKRVI